MKFCRRCKETKSVEEFYRQKKASDGRHTYCKTCCLAANNEYNRRPEVKTKVRARENAKRAEERAELRALRDTGQTLNIRPVRDVEAGKVAEVQGFSNGLYWASVCFECYTPKPVDQFDMTTGVPSKVCNSCRD